MEIRKQIECFDPVVLNISLRQEIILNHIISLAEKESGFPRKNLYGTLKLAIKEIQIKYNTPFSVLENVDLDQRMEYMDELTELWETHLSFILSKKQSLIVPTMMQKIREWLRLVPSPSELTKEQGYHPFHHLIVLNTFGLPLYTKSWTLLREGSILITGLMSGLMSLTEHVIGSQLKTMQTEEGTFLLIERNNEHGLVLVIIAEYDKDYIRKILKHLSEKFVEFYKDKLKNWKGDRSVFQDFTKYIDDLINSIPF